MSDLSAYNFETAFEVVYEADPDHGVNGETPPVAGVRIDVQTGELRRTSRSPIFLRTDGDHRPAFRCTAEQAREIATAFNTAADMAEGHAV